MPRGAAVLKLILFAAILSLAIMVVALGFAAKHSQFEHHAHHSFYLGKAVKMVSDDAPAHAFLVDAPAPLHAGTVTPGSASPLPNLSPLTLPLELRNTPLLV